MKNFVTNVLALVICVALAIGGIVWVTGSDQTTWPDFSAAEEQAATTPLAPQVVTQYERDFGWRIGDVIPIQIFLKQQPGTRVDLHSLAVEGDFEIVEAPGYVTRDFKDGSRYIGIKFKIQSMSNAKQLSLKVSMLYRHLETDDDHLIAIPAFTPHTSPTWDGRDVVQDGEPQYIHDGHLVWTLGYILLGLAGALAAWRLKRLLATWVVEERKRVWDTRRQIARREFDEAWAGLAIGDYSVENFKAVARCVRKLFRIESKVLREIEMELGGAHPYRVQTLKILELTGKVLYQKRALSKDELLAIKSNFDQIVPPPAVVQAKSATKPSPR